MALSFEALASVPDVTSSFEWPFACLIIQLLTYPIVHVGRLVIDIKSKNAHLSVLKGALVSCTISVPDGSTIGIYYDLNLSGELKIFL